MFGEPVSTRAAKKDRCFDIKGAKERGAKGHRKRKEEEKMKKRGRKEEERQKKGRRKEKDLDERKQGG